VLAYFRADATICAISYVTSRTCRDQPWAPVSDRLGVFSGYVPLSPAEMAGILARKVPWTRSHRIRGRRRMARHAARSAERTQWGRWSDGRERRWQHRRTELPLAQPKLPQRCTRVCMEVPTAVERRLSPHPSGARGLRCLRLRSDYATARGRSPNSRARCRCARAALRVRLALALPPAVDRREADSYHPSDTLRLMPLLQKLECPFELLWITWSRRGCRRGEPR
jgi:hypothetical protein